MTIYLDSWVSHLFSSMTSWVFSLVVTYLVSYPEGHLTSQKLLWKCWSHSCTTIWRTSFPQWGSLLLFACVVRALLVTLVEETVLSPHCGILLWSHVTACTACQRTLRKTGETAFIWLIHFHRILSLGDIGRYSKEEQVAHQIKYDYLSMY